MAQIESTELFRFENFDATIAGKTVGNNRTVTHRHNTVTADDGVTRKDCLEIVGALHGHPVFRMRKFNPKDAETWSTTHSLRLDTCGYLTTTTRAAMDDFLRAAGLRSKVSIAGSELNCWLFFKDGGSHKLRTNGQCITVALSDKDMAEFQTIHALA